MSTRLVTIAAAIAACRHDDVTVLHDGTIRGTVLASWYKGQYSEAVTARTLDRVARTGFNSVSVVTTWYQSSRYASELAPDDNRSPTDDDVRAALRAANALGLHVTLKPHLDLQDDTWRGEIYPADEIAWFASYTAFIVQHALMAEEEGAEALVIGTELSGIQWSERWRDVIAATREVYGGQLIYAANWDSFHLVPWWDAVDRIGVDAYFPLTQRWDPSPAALADAWRPLVNLLDDFGRTQKKDIVITELGYQARDGANTSPWWAPSETPDAEEQADCLNAALIALASASRIEGAHIWKTHYDPEADADGFDVLGKAAEDVITAQWQPP